MKLSIADRINPWHEAKGARRVLNVEIQLETAVSKDGHAGTRAVRLSGNQIFIVGEVLHAAENFNAFGNLVIRRDIGDYIVVGFAEA